jgi:hypothetical protein
MIYPGASAPGKLYLASPLAGIGYSFTDSILKGQILS